MAQLRCDKGHVFDESEAGTHREYEGAHVVYRSYCCPKCGNQDMSEGYTCGVCGDWVYREDVDADKASELLCADCWEKTGEAA